MNIKTRIPLFLMTIYHINYFVLGEKKFDYFIYWIKILGLSKTQLIECLPSMPKRYFNPQHPINLAW